ncbi:DUF3310 domain-containing protein [uncultured Psychrobacter sp.]|uniref:DUF3310 domain-containing protein n=1 Tax=uncultured Psychrobacter sp. TaxID=259303 RepID=UPI002595F0B5|nr:DUF3310 domain-containing protein [uncultured Psychrobacter sp.]
MEIKRGQVWRNKKSGNLVQVVPEPCVLVFTSPKGELVAEHSLVVFEQLYEPVATEDAQMIKPKHPSSVRNKGLAGMLPKVEVEGEERVMEIKAGQIWKCKRFGVERLVTGVSDSYVFMGTTMLIKDLFLRDYEFVRDEHETSEPAKREPDMVNKPPHYKDASGIECIEVTRNMQFCSGNCFKYLYRAGQKGSAVEDLEKAAWYASRAWLGNEQVCVEAANGIELVARYRSGFIQEAMLSMKDEDWLIVVDAIDSELEMLGAGNE